MFKLYMNVIMLIMSLVFVIRNNKNQDSSFFCLSSLQCHFTSLDVYGYLHPYKTIYLGLRLAGISLPDQKKWLYLIFLYSDKSSYTILQILWDAMKKKNCRFIKNAKSWFTTSRNWPGPGTSITVIAWSDVTTICYISIKDLMKTAA